MLIQRICLRSMSHRLLINDIGCMLMAALMGSCKGLASVECMLRAAPVGTSTPITIACGTDETAGRSGGSQHCVQKGYPGTLFRLPLRSKVTAACSEVCKEPGSLERIEVRAA